MDRYQFQKHPSGDEFLSDNLAFQHGVFEEVGINDLTVYHDGLIVASRASTDLLDKFIEDLSQFAEQEFGIAHVDVPPHERHYESAVVVRMSIREQVAAPWATGLKKHLTSCQASYGLRPFEFALSAIQVAHDPLSSGGRQPIPFTLARRVNTPFDADIYYSSAPLRTEDHVRALEILEPHLS